MDCPKCGRYLGEGMLPARCPHCGANLSNPTDSIRGSKAAASRKNVEGLTGIGKGNTQNKRRRYFQVCVGIILVVAFGALLYYATSGFGTEGELSVPDLVGWNRDRAEEELASLGYTAVVEDVLSEDGSSGLVVSQEPEPGTPRPKFSEVILRVSTSIAMPDIVGRPWPEVQAELDSQGIAYEATEQLSSEAEGTVLSSSITSGTAIGRDDVVDIIVAKRPIVPDLSGLTPDEASSKLTVLLLKLETQDVLLEGDQKAGTIVGQEPAAESAVAAGTTVVGKVACTPDEFYTNAAMAALNAVYNTSPADDGIGAALLPLLSSESEFAGQSAHDVWWNLVKRGGRYADQPAELQSLPRSIVDAKLSIDPEKREVSATVTVDWDWTGLPGAGAKSSQDTRTVTLTFDKEGKLLGFYDEQTDVPFFKVNE